MSSLHRAARGELKRVLVVDDEPDIRELIDLTLSRMGVAADAVGSVAEALECLGKNHYQLCLTDMRLPDGDGLQVVQHLATHAGDVPVAVITAFGSTDNAVAALKAGAFDYLSKPLGLEQLRALVKNALRLADSPSPETPTALLLGDSPAMQAVRETIGKLARSQAPIYISGESGSGKELAARQIHALGVRSEAPFVPVNCGAIPEALMESEFFGYRKGAFTGAESEREGFFQTASGGTLFLDEVADLPLPMQVKLLRAIQEKRVRKVGSPQEEPVDVRIICATHRDLQLCVEQGTFRQDLYYRLNVIELKMPPLRDRPEDIVPLAKALLHRLGSPLEFSEAALQALAKYAFPGNVRELENILERATALCSGNRINPEDLGLPESVQFSEARRATETLDDYMNRLEREALVQALAKTGHNRTAAARLLGISFRSLRYRLDRLGID